MTPSPIERAEAVARTCAIDVLSNCAAHYSKPESFSAAFGGDPQKFIDRAIENATRTITAALLAARAEQAREDADFVNELSGLEWHELVDRLQEVANKLEKQAMGVE